MNARAVYRPVRFFLVVFLITWSFGFAAAFFSYREGMQGVEGLLMIPGLFAPFLGTLIMTGGARNRELRREFWRRLSLSRIRAKYLPAILLIMPCALFLGTAVSLLFGRPASQFLLSGEYRIVSGQLLVSVLILILAPTLEELGWRGYGVDSLRSRMNLFWTSMVFALIWGLWHLPLFFINGYYQHELWKAGGVYVANFFVQVFVAAILMNWVYYRSRRSITAAILFHFMFNISSVVFRTGQFTKIIITGILLLVAAVVVIANRGFFFRETEPNVFTPGRGRAG